MARKFIPTPATLLVRGDEVWGAQSRWEVERDGSYGLLVLTAKDSTPPFYPDALAETTVTYGTQSGASRLVRYYFGEAVVVVERV